MNISYDNYSMMDQLSKIDLLRDMVRYHENIKDYQTRLSTIYGSFFKNEAMTAWQEFFNFFRTDIIEHFKFEESIVFPAILKVKTDDTTKQYIAKLMATHKELVKKGITLFDLFSWNKYNISDRDAEEILNSVKAFSVDTMVHNENERKGLLPIIKESRSIRFLLGRSVITYQNIYKEKYLKQNQEKDSTEQVDFNKENLSDFIERLK